MSALIAHPYPVPPSNTSTGGPADGSNIQTANIVKTQETSYGQREEDDSTQQEEEEDPEEIQERKRKYKKTRDNKCKNGLDQPNRALRSKGKIEETELGYKNRKEVTQWKERAQEESHISRPDGKGGAAQERPMLEGATPYPGGSTVPRQPIRRETDSPASGPFTVVEGNTSIEGVENGRQPQGTQATVGAVGGYLRAETDLIQETPEQNTNRYIQEGRELNTQTTRRLAFPGTPLSAILSHGKDDRRIERRLFTNKETEEREDLNTTITETRKIVNNIQQEVIIEKEGDIQELEYIQPEGVTEEDIQVPKSIQQEVITEKEGDIQELEYIQPEDITEEDIQVPESIQQEVITEKEGDIQELEYIQPEDITEEDIQVPESIQQVVITEEEKDIQEPEDIQQDDITEREKDIHELENKQQEDNTSEVGNIRNIRATRQKGITQEENNNKRTEGQQITTEEGEQNNTQNEGQGQEEVVEEIQEDHKNLKETEIEEGEQDIRRILGEQILEYRIEYIGDTGEQANQGETIITGADRERLIAEIRKDWKEINDEKKRIEEEAAGNKESNKRGIEEISVEETERIRREAEEDTRIAEIIGRELTAEEIEAALAGIEEKIEAESKEEKTRKTNLKYREEAKIKWKKEKEIEEKRIAKEAERETRRRQEENDIEEKERVPDKERNQDIKDSSEEDISSNGGEKEWEAIYQKTGKDDRGSLWRENREGLYEEVEEGVRISYNKEKARREKRSNDIENEDKTWEGDKDIEEIIEKTNKIHIARIAQLGRKKKIAGSETDREHYRLGVLRHALKYTGENRGQIYKLKDNAQKEEEQRRKEREEDREILRRERIKRDKEQEAESESEKSIDTDREEGGQELIVAAGEIEDEMPNPGLRLPTFTGARTEDYEVFLDEIEGMAGVCNWTNNEHLQYVKLSIKGPAATWMKAIPNDEKDTYQKVKDILKDTFADKRTGWQKHQDLGSLRQEKGQSVRDFALKLREYDGPGREDASMISVFVSGVKESIGDELEKTTQLTFKGAVQKAEMLEAIEKRKLSRKCKLGMMEVYDTRENNLKGYVEGRNDERYTDMVEMCAMEYNNKWGNAGMGSKEEVPRPKREEPPMKGRAEGYGPGPAAPGPRPQGAGFQGPQYNGPQYNGPQYNRANANQYNNNRMQGQNREAMDKEKGSIRVREYTRLLGELPMREIKGKYCLIHDVNTHTTDECFFLTQFRERMEGERQGNAGRDQGQGNGRAGPFQSRN